jgi:hypothetical protein
LTSIMIAFSEFNKSLPASLILFMYIAAIKC